MNFQLILTFVILFIAIGLFLSVRLRADLVALLTLVALGLSGILTPQEAFSGFSRSAVITISAIFILAEGLQRTGVTEQVGNLLLRVTGHHESRLVAIVMLIGAFLSLFMNSIAAASVLLPAVSRAGQKASVNPGRILMPLAFATLLGGMATLLTTTNIVVSSLLRDQGLAGYSLLDFASVGLPIVAVGIAYMTLIGRHLLPAQSLPDRLEVTHPPDGDLIEVYRLGERLFRAHVPLGSVLQGRLLAESSLREHFNMTVVAIEHNGQVTLSPPPDYILQQGDIIFFTGNLAKLHQRDIEPYFETLPARDWRTQDLESPAVVMAEAVLAPRSRLIGQTLRQANFREKYGMTVLALWRGDRQIRTGLTNQPLHFGDALLLQGPRDRLRVLRAEPDLIVLGNSQEAVKMMPGKSRLALVIMGIVLLMAAISPTRVGEVTLSGALVMVLVGVLTMDQAYQSIEWRSVFLVAGMLPMGIAITKTGAAALLADWLVAFLGVAGLLVLLAGLFVVTTLMTQAMNGAAVAAVMAPIAIEVAQSVGADPRAMAMGVALASSMAFLTPLGHPVNVLVMGPGGYSFRDYFRVGLPLTLLLFIMIMLLLPLFWPLTSK